MSGVENQADQSEKEIPVVIIAYKAILGDSQKIEKCSEKHSLIRRINKRERTIVRRQQKPAPKKGVL
jgi:hypothetical protein